MNLLRPQALPFIEGNHVLDSQLTARRDWLTVDFPSATSVELPFFVRQRFVSALALYALRAWVPSTQLFDLWECG